MNKFYLGRFFDPCKGQNSERAYIRQTVVSGYEQPMSESDVAIITADGYTIIDTLNPGGKLVAVSRETAMKLSFPVWHGSIA